MNCLLHYTLVGYIIYLEAGCCIWRKDRNAVTRLRND